MLCRRGTATIRTIDRMTFAAGDVRHGVHSVNSAPWRNEALIKIGAFGPMSGNAAAQGVEQTAKRWRWS